MIAKMQQSNHSEPFALFGKWIGLPFFAMAFALFAGMVINNLIPIRTKTYTVATIASESSLWQTVHIVTVEGKTFACPIGWISAMNLKKGNSFEVAELK